MLTLCASAGLVWLALCSGCESGDDFIRCDREEFVQIIIEEQIKAELCMKPGSTPMEIDSMTADIVDGDPAHGYEMWSEGHKDWIGGKCYPVGRDHRMMIAVDPRNPGCVMNRRRIQWEWKNSMTHGADGRTSKPWPDWMDWNYRP
jgi:hypothetical protein